MTAIIAAAPNGSRFGKADHPELPLSEAEIVTCCEGCVAEGAAMLHLHVRNRDAGTVLMRRRRALSRMPSRGGSA